MFENTRDKKKRADPERSQLGNLTIKGNGSGDQQRDRRMIDISSGDERDRACVIDAIRVGVDPLVELGRSTQRQRPEKSGGSDDRDRSTPSRAAFHWRRLSNRLTELATVFCQPVLTWPGSIR